MSLLIILDCCVVLLNLLNCKHFYNLFLFYCLSFVGDDSWPPGCCLKFCYGDQMTHIDRVMSVSLSPGQVTDISIDMVSPSKTGIYQGQWRMITPSGCYFGGLWFITF